jgi:hypothetical protein
MALGGQFVLSLDSPPRVVGQDLVVHPTEQSKRLL